MDDAVARRACDAAIAELGVRALPGTVTLLVPAKDRIVVTRVKTSDIRAARRLTSFSAGAA